MARVTLLTKMLLSFALMVAAWPRQASAVPCGVKPVAKCAMACCAEKPMRECMAPKSDVAKSDSCGCDLHSLPALPADSPKANLSTFDLGSVFAPLSASFDLDVAKLMPLEPGVLGLDSGPPPSPPARYHASRAPPVVRVRPSSTRP